MHSKRISLWQQGLLVLGLCLLSAAPVPALADVRVVYENSGKALFSINAPDGWEITTGMTGQDGATAPRIMGLHPEGDFSLWLGFLSPAEPKTLEEAEAYARDLGKNLISDGKIEKIEGGNLGGMPTRHYTGRGTREGAPVDFSVVIVRLPGNRAAIAIFIGEYGAREVYKTDIEAIVKSFKAEEASQ